MPAQHDNDRVLIFSINDPNINDGVSVTVHHIYETYDTPGADGSYTFDYSQPAHVVVSYDRIDGASVMIPWDVWLRILNSSVHQVEQ